MSERGMYLSKNGLILKNDKTFEILVIFVYPLLSFFWSIFFGTTQEAYSIYRSLWRWLKNLSCAWRGKQRVMDDEGHNDDEDQQQQQETTLQETLPSPPPPPKIHLDLTATISSHTSTLISAAIPHSISSPKTPISPATSSDRNTASYVTALMYSRPTSSASSLFDDYKLLLHSTDRRAFSSIPCFPDRTTHIRNHSTHSTIDIGSISATGSSVTLVNHRSY
jgi:hypothetical protein